MQLLYCKRITTSANTSQLPVVFLHGFLGDSQEWLFLNDRKLSSTFAEEFNCYALDLPGHGLSADINLANKAASSSKPLTPISPAPTSILLTPDAEGFRQTSELISKTLSAHGIKQYHLVGYSLGARIALFHNLYLEQQGKNSVHSLVLESGNFGLNTEQEKQQRLENDALWAQKFTKLPAEQALTLWYQQAVFSSFSAKQQKALVEKRKHIQGESVAKMLLATSLAKQPNLNKLIKQSKTPLYYFYGQNDQKFKTLAKHYQATNKQLNVHGFNDAGHNIHYQQQVDFINTLIQVLSRS